MKIKLPEIIANIISSNWLFAYTLALFAAESSWLAVTSRFPMAFDEAYHFGLIQFFSHRLSPIVTSQTPATYRYGAIIQDPSFLYHYLLSFPYRLVSLFTNQPEPHVIVLRLINVVIALCSLLVMRKLLRAFKVSDGLANLVLLAFALTPIVTVLSAQINYDNLLVLAVALCVYASIRFTQQLDKGVFDSRRFLTLVCYCLFASLVKFAFLPILLAIVGVVAWRVAVFWRRRGGRRVASSARKTFAAISTGARIGLLTAGLLGGFLFIRFYGVNLVRYHNPAPECNQVLDAQKCGHYYAWELDAATLRYAQTHSSTHRMSVVHYTFYWLRFAGEDVYGEIMPLQGPFYQSPVFYPVVILLTATALGCTAFTLRKILRDPQRVILVAVPLVYLAFLWGRNYHDYVHLGQPVAINGRYWVPILIYIYTLAGLSMQRVLAGQRQPAAMLKTALAVLVVCVFVGLGGYWQYLTEVTPRYGRLAPSNAFVLPDIHGSNFP